jgi:hypothetical protein
LIVVNERDLPFVAQGEVDAIQDFDIIEFPVVCIPLGAGEELLASGQEMVTLGYAEGETLTVDQFMAAREAEKESVLYDGQPGGVAPFARASTPSRADSSWPASPVGCPQHTPGHTPARTPGRAPGRRLASSWDNSYFSQQGLATPARYSDLHYMSLMGDIFCDTLVTNSELRLWHHRSRIASWFQSSASPGSQVRCAALGRCTHSAQHMLRRRSGLRRLGEGCARLPARSTWSTVTSHSHPKGIQHTIGCLCVFPSSAVSNKSACSQMEASRSTNTTKHPGYASRHVAGMRWRAAQ